MKNTKGKEIIYAFFLFVAIVFLSACASEESAMVDENIQLFASRPLGDIPTPSTALSAPSCEGLKVTLIGQVFGWAAAWQEKRIDSYFSFYTAGFKQTPGETHEAWRARRRQRIEANKDIRIWLNDISLDCGDKVAIVRFEQFYESATVRRSRTTKTLDFVFDGIAWLIRAESTH